MCGAYIGMDEYRSRLAVLREKFARSNVSNDINDSFYERSIWNPIL